MIKLLKLDETEKNSWKVEINGTQIVDVEYSKLFESLSIETSFVKSLSLFFDETVSNFYELFRQEKDFKEIEMSININDLLDKEISDMFSVDTLKEIDDKDKDLEIIKKAGLKIVLRRDEKFYLILLSLPGLFLNPFWKKPFSVFEYYKYVEKEMKLESENLNREAAKEFEIDVLGLGMFPIILKDKNFHLKSLIYFYLEKFKEAHHKAFEYLLQEGASTSLITKFSNFPKEVRVPCEQYLLFFETFLKDLGINVTTGITHEAGDILFSVTPANPKQALDKIKTALDIYLQLPKSEIVIAPDEEFEIAMFKAKANIDHLNSQLSLAKAEIRVKEREIQAFEATLEAKDISIEFLREKLNQQKRLLNGEIAEGIIETEPKFDSDDKEEFLDGIIALKQYEDKGVQVNLAKLYRKLRDFFKED